MITTKCWVAILRDARILLYPTAINMSLHFATIWLDVIVFSIINELYLLFREGRHLSHEYRRCWGKANSRASTLDFPRAISTWTPKSNICQDRSKARRIDLGQYFE